MLGQLVLDSQISSTASQNKSISVQSPNSNLSLSYIFQGGAPVGYVRPSYFIVLNGGEFNSINDAIIDVRIYVVTASGASVTFTIYSQISKAFQVNYLGYCLVIYNA